MTKPSQRTRSQRRIALTLPSGRKTLHFQPKKGGTPTCSRCGTELHGVISSRTRSKSGSLRVPSRPFGGILCHDCLSSEIRRLARATGTDA